MIVVGIAEHLRKANITFSLEQRNPRNDSRQRPGDIFIANYDTRGPAYLDVSVIHILARSFLRRASIGQLEGSKIRYDYKMSKYPDLGSSFKPSVVESTGGWHAASFNTLRSLAVKMSVNTGKSTSVLLNGMLATCSVRLQRSLGSHLLRRCQGY